MEAVRAPAIRYDRYPEAEGHNWYELDPNLRFLLRQHLDDPGFRWAEPRLSAFGELVGTKVAPRASVTDRPEGRPRLVSFDRTGADISLVVHNPGRLQTARDVYGAGIVGLHYGAAPGAPARVPWPVTFAMGYLLSQAEAGFYCPVTLTATCAYLLDKYADPELKSRYLPALASPDPDHLLEGATWLTEKTGGSDVGAIESVARRDGDTWRIYGEKWFASNAEAGLALVLARPEGAPPGTRGLAMFAVPRVLPDGSRNAYRIRRLKDKLGTMAVATGEIELDGAQGFLVGDPARGFKYMIQGLVLSRLCNAVASAGMMRRSFLEAVIYASHRVAFGRTIDSYPLVRDDLVDMLIELEAAAALTFQTTAYWDRAEAGDARAAKLARLLVPLSKQWTGERAVEAASDAIELFGGNGYVEEYVTPRLLRDAQVTTVWEGTANILALDVLRALSKDGAGEPYFAEVEEMLARVTHPALAELLRDARRALDDVSTVLRLLGGADEDYATLHGRRLSELMTEAFIAALLLRDAEAGLAEGDARKAVVARLFFAKRIAPRPLRGVGANDRTVLRHFAALTGYGGIRPDDM